MQRKPQITNVTYFPFLKCVCVCVCTLYDDCIRTAGSSSSSAIGSSFGAVFFLGNKGHGTLKTRPV